MSEQEKPPESPDAPGPAENQAKQPAMPVDMMIARFQLWVEKMEKRQAEAIASARIPDDIPRFVTRKP